MNSDQFYEKYGIFVEFLTFNGTMPAMHEHPTYEMYFLIHGDRTYFVEDSVFRLQNGEVALIPPHVLHKTGGKSGNRILLAFRRNYLEKYFTSQAIETLVCGFKYHHRTPKKEDAEKIINICNEIRKLQEKDTDDGLFILVAELLKILNNSPTAEIAPSPSKKLIADITDYVNLNYSEIKGVEDTAEKFYINKCYLCRIFKKVTGIPFVTYLNSVRLGHAADLLLSSTKEVSEIATLCGFNSNSYFCNMFKIEFGMTPRAYRMGNKKQK